MAPTSVAEKEAAIQSGRQHYWVFWPTGFVVMELEPRRCLQLSAFYLSRSSSRSSCDARCHHTCSGPPWPWSVQLPCCVMQSWPPTSRKNLRGALMLRLTCSISAEHLSCNPQRELCWRNGGLWRGRIPPSLIRLPLP
ncbi:hypothetical protein [Bradyrhizobium sp. CCBAU 45384]|uniref:hypothetical protein n=1 Tax=Bradyrhizobium sp. CCBAU 45384 TaxID=858428 RepID=UPI0023068262|nr:hypothetical protein [Bradyrhizobium sp. CCBAU 45384]